MQEPMELKNVTVMAQGRHLALYAMDYKLPDGSHKIYETATRIGKAWADKPDGVSVCVIDPAPGRPRILALREFRPAVNRWVWRLPEGIIEPGETPRQTMERELLEETGVKISAVDRELPAAYANDAVGSTRITQIFAYADAAKYKNPEPAQDNPLEPIEPHWLSRSEANQLLNWESDMNARLQLAIMYFLEITL